MKLFLFLAVVIAFCLPAQAQNEAEEKAAAPQVTPPAIMEPAIPEILVPKTVKMVKPAAKDSRVQAELNFLKASAEDPNEEVQAATAEDLEFFVAKHADGELGAEGQFALAALRAKKGDYDQAVVDWLRFLNEYPDSKLGFEAKRGYLEIVEKRMPRKLRSFLSEMAKVSTAEEKSERLAIMLHALIDQTGEAFYEALEEDAAWFSARFPDYSQGDKILWDLADLRRKKSKHAAAAMAYKKLLALHPESSRLPQAQWELAQIYAERLREPEKAVAAFHELVERYPSSPYVQPALETMAKILEEKLKQYDPAVDIHEKIVKLFPKSEAALKALQAQVRLQRDRLSRPAEAVKTCRRLAQEFPVPAAVEALQKAAAIARKDLKDYKLEIELRRQVAADFSSSPAAVEELFTVAEVWEDDLKDLDKAAEAYKEVAAKFPTHKLAKKAESRLAKIEKNKS